MREKVILWLVNGDFRKGNFIVCHEGIRAVLDWEIAHLGDPMEISDGCAFIRGGSVKLTNLLVASVKGRFV